MEEGLHGTQHELTRHYYFLCFFITHNHLHSSIHMSSIYPKYITQFSLLKMRTPKLMVGANKLLSQMIYLAQGKAIYWNENKSDNDSD